MSYEGWGVLDFLFITFEWIALSAWMFLTFCQTNSVKLTVDNKKVNNFEVFGYETEFAERRWLQSHH